MILANTPPALVPSPYPVAPLKADLIPARQTQAVLDYALSGPTTADRVTLARIAVDHEKRATLDLEHLERKAMAYAGVLGEIDALHIEWAQTNMLDPANNLALWDRLGAILRKAGI